MFRDLALTFDVSMSYSVDDVASNAFKKMNDIGQFFLLLIAQDP